MQVAAKQTTTQTTAMASQSNEALSGSDECKTPPILWPKTPHRAPIPPDPFMLGKIPGRKVQYRTRTVLLVMLLISLTIHVLSYIKLGIFSAERQHKTIQPPITFHLPELKDEAHKPITEAKQSKTAPPKDPHFLAETDHSTEHETKVSKQMIQKKAADAGLEGNPNAQDKAIHKAEKKQVQTASPTSNYTIPSNTGKLSIAPMNAKPRNKYEEILPNTQDLQGQFNAGYQEFIKDDIAEGTRVDINTSEYRYIGYFTNMRKAIELVWIYPQEAVRQEMQGETHVEFVIAKNGKVSRVRVIRSSGYAVLDRAIVEAIQMASPFAPLPDGFKTERLIVNGAFRYVLSGFGGAH